VGLDNFHVAKSVVYKVLLPYAGIWRGDNERVVDMARVANSDLSPLPVPTTLESLMNFGNPDVYFAGRGSHALMTYVTSL